MVETAGKKARLTLRSCPCITACPLRLCVTGGRHEQFPPGWDKHPPLPTHAHALVAGGTPGWQIALSAAGAALLGAALAVIVYRLRAARRRVTVSTA